MLERWLDVCFQYRRPLAAALVLVPCLLAAAGLWTDRLQAVEARVRVEQPILLLNNTTYPASSGRPADTAIRLLRELVATDSFLNPVLAAADAGFTNRDGTSQSLLRRAFRDHLRIAADGPEVMTLTDRTDQPAVGIARLSALITDFENRAVVTVAGQVSHPPVSTETLLQTAHQTVTQAYGQLGRRPPVTTAPLRRLYLLEHMWEAEADAVAAPYRAQLAQTEPVSITDSTLAGLRQGMFALSDPPAARAKSLDISPLAGTLFWLGLALATGIAFLLTLGVSLAERRLRSATDVQWRTEIPYLGSTPRLAS